MFSSKTLLRSYRAHITFDTCLIKLYCLIWLIVLFVCVCVCVCVCMCVCVVFIDASISLSILKIQNFFRSGSYVTKVLFNSLSTFLPFNIRNNTTVAMLIFIIFNCYLALWKYIARPSRDEKIASSTNTFCQ